MPSRVSPTLAHILPNHGHRHDRRCFLSRTPPFLLLFCLCFSSFTKYTESRSFRSSRTLAEFLSILFHSPPSSRFMRLHSASLAPCSVSHQPDFQAILLTLFSPLVLHPLFIVIRFLHQFSHFFYINRTLEAGKEGKNE